MNEGIALFKQEARQIAEYSPELHYSESDIGLPIISGELLLTDEEGLFIDSYSIRIQPIPEYPYKFPHVFEVGGRIPNNIDWHVFSDGHCCIKSPPEESLLCKKGITLIAFIEKQLKPYFFNQKYRELNGFFLHERSHGEKGNIEFFEDLLQTKDLKSIEKILFSICYEREPKSNSKCLCGNRRKFKKCHRRAYRKLKYIPIHELKSFRQIVNAILSS
jgi:hypothetical protein